MGRVQPPHTTGHVLLKMPRVRHCAVGGSLFVRAPQPNLCGLDQAQLIHELDMIGTTAEAMMGTKKQQKVVYQSARPKVRVGTPCGNSLLCPVP